MKNVVAPVYDYEAAGDLVGHSHRTIQQYVSEGKIHAIQVKGRKPVIAFEELVRYYAAKNSVDKERAEAYLRERIVNPESEKQSPGHPKKTKKPVVRPQTATDVPATEEDSVETPENNEGGDVPAAIGTDQCYIYTGKQEVEGRNQKQPKEKKEPMRDKNGVTKCQIWMYTFPFDDRNPEFGISPEEFMTWSTPENPEKRLKFIADSFMNDPVVLSVFAALCSSGSGYYHFHVIVMFKERYLMSSAFNKPGNHPHLLAVQREQKLPNGKKIRHRYSIQKCIEYILADGEFEGRKAEKIIGDPEIRGTALFEAAKKEKAAAQSMDRFRQAVDDAVNGMTLIEIRKRYPEFDNSGSEKAIRKALQRAALEKLGGAGMRKVNVILVLGEPQSGKTSSVYETLTSNGLAMAKYAEDKGLETYDSQPVLQIDHPNQRWCPYDQFTKLLSDNIVQISVRVSGSVHTLWEHVVVEASSIDDIVRGYSPALFGPDKARPIDVRSFLTYVDTVRYCFEVRTDRQFPTYHQDGYSSEPTDGYRIRFDYVDIPVSRYFPGKITTEGIKTRKLNDDIIRTIARIYFDVTKTRGRKIWILEDAPIDENYEEASCDYEEKALHEGYRPVYEKYEIAPALEQVKLSAVEREIEEEVLSAMIENDGDDKRADFIECFKAACENRRPDPEADIDDNPFPTEYDPSIYPELEQEPEPDDYRELLSEFGPDEHSGIQSDT